MSSHPKRAPTARRASDLRVLLYHRVEDPGAPRPDLAPNLVEATPRRLDAHLAHLARFHTPVGWDEVRAALRGTHTLPERAVLVTFDDGYRDFLEISWPLLKKHRVPAVLFVPTAFVDDPDRLFWWDALWQMLARTTRTQVTLPAGPTLPLSSWVERQQASRQAADWYKARPLVQRASLLDALSTQLGVRAEPTRAVLSWTELGKLAADGACIAGHSQTHELLDDLQGARLDVEVAGCRDDLVRGLGSSAPLFAYPNGNFHAAATRALRAAGYEAAFTVVHGLNQLPTNSPYELRRDQGAVGMARFALHLLGPVARYRARRNPLPRYAAEPEVGVGSP